MFEGSGVKMTSKDILVFMSDQHSPIFSSFEGGIVRTPNMEKLCEDGTSFTQAYTPCPLCVPARISMLLGRYPYHTGMYSNDGAIPETSPTFIHSLVEAGYETVLIGRMHFIGSNQRHGFTKRLVGDVTPVTWNRPADKLAEERGVFFKCYSDPGCLGVIGGGNSPVLEYDKDVINAALDYLSKPHEKPQFILVGTYGPHFPYTAPPELYKYYKELIDIPESFNNPPGFLEPLYKNRIKEVSQETLVKARAAYFGMIETIDKQMGEVREAFNQYLKTNRKEGIFAYISDHGDQVGDRRIFGKQTFFETSARVPMIFEGKDILKGQKMESPVSLIDLGSTLCELAGATLPAKQDGVSLVPSLCEGKTDETRTVFSELMLRYNKEPFLSTMVRRSDFKYIRHHGYEEYDMLFNLADDPEELSNVAASFNDKVKEMAALIPSDLNPEKILNDRLDYIESVKLVKAWEQAAGVQETERWQNTCDEARKMPKVQ